MCRFALPLLGVAPTVLQIFGKKICPFFFCLTSHPMPVSVASAPSLVALKGPLRALCLTFLMVQFSGCCCFTFGEDKEKGAAAAPEATEVAAPLATELPALALDAPPPSGTARKAQRATVHAVWFSTGKVSGGASPVTVKVEPTPGGRPGVAVMEQYADGTGDMWQSAAWIAAFNASRMTGHALGDHEFTVKTGAGSIDGPSAGMLLTATMIALIRGDKVREDATMTGTVNPDGTAGPVGGIHQKMTGAKAEGKTRFGYPMGTRVSFDMETKRQGDVEDTAKLLGMEATELKDVHDAYELLTGKALPRQMVTEAQMALGPVAEAPLREKLVEVVDEIGAKAKQLTDSRPFKNAVVMRALQPLILALDATVKEAGDLAGQNSFALATLRLRQALAYLHMVEDSASLYELVLQKDYQGALDLTQRSARSLTDGVEGIKVLIDRHAGVKTLGGQLNVINALTTYVNLAHSQSNSVRGLNLVIAELDALQQGGRLGSVAALDQLFIKLRPPLQEMAIAKAQMDVVEDQLRAEQQEEGTPLLAAASKLQSLSSAYASASTAGLYVVDSVILDTGAKATGMSKAQYAQSFDRFEPMYGLAQTSQFLARVQDEELEANPKGAAMLQLAAGANAYNLTAELLNKYYNLDMDSKTQQVAKPKVLRMQLESARRQARASAWSCTTKVGFIPTSARFYYQLALELASGKTDADRLKSLGYFWASSFWSELAMNLGQ